MNSSQDRPQYDELDRRLQQALLDCPVDQQAKQRVRARLVGLSSAVDTESAAMSDQVLDGMVTEPTLELNSPASTHDAATATSRRRFIRLGIGLVTAACLILSMSLLFVRGATSQSQLVTICSDLMNAALNRTVQWNHPQGLAELEFLQEAGLNRQPASVVWSKLVDPPVGQSGRLWKLSFNGHRDLYVLEFFHASAIAGVHSLVRNLPASTSGWSVAASQDLDGHLVVFMARENLQQYLQLVPLA